jgi:hypothetical protein
VKSGVAGLSDVRAGGGTDERVKQLAPAEIPTAVEDGDCGGQ